jgi:hypothetical protein
LSCGVDFNLPFGGESQTTFVTLNASSQDFFRELPNRVGG